MKDREREGEQARERLKDNVLRQQVRQVFDLNAVPHASNNLNLWIRCLIHFYLADKIIATHRKITIELRLKSHCNYAIHLLVLIIEMLKDRVELIRREKTCMRLGNALRTIRL